MLYALGINLARLIHVGHARDNMDVTDEIDLQIPSATDRI